MVRVQPGELQTACARLIASSEQAIGTGIQCAGSSVQRREAGDCGGTAVDAELRIRLLEVLGHGRGRDPQPARDLVVREAFGDEAEHLAFARCQAWLVRCRSRKVSVKSPAASTVRIEPFLRSV